MKTLDRIAKFICPTKGIIRHIDVFYGQKDSKWYFHGIAWNGEIVLPSQPYETQASVEKTVEQVADQLGVHWKYVTIHGEAKEGI